MTSTLPPGAGPRADGPSEAAARLLLALPFIFGGLQHLVRPGEVAARLEHGPLSYLATAIAPAETMVVATGWLLIAGGLGIAVGLLTRWAALGSMALLVAISTTALVGVRDEAGPLIKNLAIFGGLLLVAARGGGAWSLDARRRMRRGAAALAGALALAAPAPGAALPAVDGPIRLAPGHEAMRVGRLWIAGRLDAAALAQARAAGVDVVVNLRDPSEPGWDEAAAAAALGMPYRNPVLPKQGPLTRAVLEAIDAAVAAHPDADVLVHCETGNRAAAWLAAYLAANQGLDAQQALAVAARAGLTKPETVAKVRDYLAGGPHGAAPFSPLSALGGGAMIGLAAALLLLLTGRVAGISGILGGIVDEPGQRRWCAAFALGLLAGGVALRLADPALLAVATDTSLATTAVAGALVGLGTQLGSGCTSGHGICGLGRGSRRSLAAVATFMASGAATVFLANHLWR